ncbi:MAG: helix-turn-helix domain-containing protein [Thermoplasmatales archaeon]|nr:helix-turn-helix domain-containing protein [Thermoplasmatales archaeon]
MKFPPSTDIRKIRKALDLTQSELAQASGISQSTIAKVERGTISASYATIVKLFETLDELGRTEDKNIVASDVASKGVVTVQHDSSVKSVSDLMKSTGFSQLPILRKDVPVGSASEKSIFNLLRQGMTMDELATTSIDKVMEDPYPLISENTPISTVTSMMAHCEAILVGNRGKIVGIITNADLLKLI